MRTSYFWVLFHVDCLRALIRGECGQKAVDSVGLRYLPVCYASLAYFALLVLESSMGVTTLAVGWPGQLETVLYGY